MEHMEFQNITTYDRAAYLILHRAVSQLNDRGQHPVYRAIRIVVPLLLLCSAVYFSFVQGPDPMLTAGGAMGALVVMVVLALGAIYAPALAMMLLMGAMISALILLGCAIAELVLLWRSGKFFQSLPRNRTSAWGRDPWA